MEKIYFILIFLISILNLIFFIVVFFILKNNQLRINNQINLEKTSEIFNLENKIIENFKILSQEIQNKLSQEIENKQEKIIASTSKLEEVGKNLESSVLEIKSVKEILAGPKNRGYLGEVMLKEILKTLPSSFYKEQFSIGPYRVDYALKISDSIIPIDSKFPIQEFNSLFNQDEKNKQSIKKDLIKKIKNKIEEISQKYILPSTTKTDFAIMYLANESIYYELISDKDFEEIWDFARQKNVFLTSPKNFEFICSSLLLVIDKQETNKNIKQIIFNLRQLDKDLLELVQQFEKSYNQLRYSFSNFQEFERTLNRVISNYRSILKTEEIIEEKIKERSLI